MKELNLLQRIEWNFGFYKLLWYCAKDEKIRKHLRKRFCRFGCHKLSNGSMSQSLFTSDKKTRKTITVNYLQCKFCNWKFFANKRDFNKYKKMEQQTKESFSVLVSAALGKQSKRRSVSGCRDSKNVSVRVSSVKKNE